MAGTADGKGVQTGGVVYDELQTGYGGFDIVHEMTQLVRVFRSKNPSTRFGGKTYQLGERQKEVPGTVLMSGKDPKSNGRLVALLAPPLIVCGVYDFIGAASEENMLQSMKRVRAALLAKK